MQGMDTHGENDNLDEFDTRRPITFSIEEGVYAEIKRTARKMGVNAAAALRMAARDFIEKHKNQPSY